MDKQWNAMNQEQMEKYKALKADVIKKGNEYANAIIRKKKFEEKNNITKAEKMKVSLDYKLDKEKIPRIDKITLDQFKVLKNESSQVRICICKSEDISETISLQTMKHFAEIEEFFGKSAKNYKVFKIDVKNDILILFVTEINVP